MVPRRHVARAYRPHTPKALFVMVTFKPRGQQRCLEQSEKLSAERLIEITRVAPKIDAELEIIPAEAQEGVGSGSSNPR